MIACNIVEQIAKDNDDRRASMKPFGKIVKNWPNRCLLLLPETAPSRAATVGACAMVAHWHGPSSELVNQTWPIPRCRADGVRDIPATRQCILRIPVLKAGCVLPGNAYSRWYLGADR